MKFRWQVNGTIEFNIEITTVKDVTDFLADKLRKEGIKLTGLTAFEIEEKKQSIIGRPRKKEV